MTVFGNFIAVPSESPLVGGRGGPGSPLPSIIDVPNGYFEASLGLERARKSPRRGEQSANSWLAHRTGVMI
jgi:hypothetical protein